jgi:hypothetical protein
MTRYAPPWLSSLIDLRTSFLSRVDDDLYYLSIRAFLTLEQVRIEDPEFRDEALSLPANWHPETPKRRDWRQGRWQESAEAEASRWKEPRYIVSRHVLHGTAGEESVADFERWAGAAGKAVDARPGSILRHPSRNKSSWLNFVAATASRGVEGCPLVSALTCDPEVYWGAEVDGPYTCDVTTNVFRASVETIDTILHYHLGEGAGFARTPVTDRGQTPPDAVTGTAAPGSPAAAEVIGRQPKGPAAAGPVPPKKTPARDRREAVKLLIEAFEENRLWGVTREVISKKADVPYKTLCKYLIHPDVKPAWERYQKKSTGKPPVNLDRLGDDTQAFSHLVRERD